MRTIPMRALAVSSLCLWAACSAPPTDTRLPPAVSPTNHRWFPLTAGTTHEFGKMTVDGAIECNSCHRPTADSFTAIHCDQCHKHTEAITQRLHLAIPASFNVDTSAVSDPALKAELRGANCYGCHPTGEKRAFSHTLITNECAQCHAETNAFAALPKANFTHRDVGAADCHVCHVITSWSDVSAAPRAASDPLRNLTVNALQPTWVATTIVSVTPDPQSIPMEMNHAATALDAGVMAVCSNCHAQADLGQYYPGVMHWSLTNLGAPQPGTCNECHGPNSPNGFVGTMDNRRSPASGEMRHDAVVWNGSAPTTTKIVTMDCHVCHQTPANLIDGPFTFSMNKDDGGVTAFHTSLTEASLPQPAGCIDCHANTRPTTPVMAATMTFDHSTALGECSTCHTSTTQWSGGKFHTATSPAPTTCLPCHNTQRPTSITGWMGTFLTSPFDYVTNGNGVTHGDDQDCVVCHSGPGTGVWGTNQNWRGGTFSHGPATVAATTCIDCHTTQRPDQLTPAVDAGYDHASSGTGDCFACHQATVTRGTYVNLLPIPGGDWRGGQSYPGARVISTPGQSVHLQTTTLNRTGSLVTSMTTGTTNLPNAFLHTSAAIPAAISPGSASAPDQMSCWHCHTSTGTTVTAFANGKFHASLTNFKATPAGAVSALPQPTACLDCHSTMRPPNVVSKTDAGTPWLLPMDHSATFTGSTVAGVAAMDCGTCHRTPGLGPTQWSDGKFHANIPGGGAPSECVSCHYPMITTPAADVTFPDAGLPSTFAMKHRSTQITTQACATCHGNALFNATMTPASTRWKPGAYHASLTSTTQPATCLECHGASSPTATTQGTVVYSLPAGGTATNGAQWMSHTHTSVTGKDCASCHLADAKVSNSAWSKAAPYHSKVTGLTTCATCHGITNGKGTVVGTNNNMPAGLTNSVTSTTSSASPTGTKDQIAHTDLNVTGKDCNFCHTQVGPSTAAGVQGVEWTKATFHNKFTTANPLVLNGTTARCSNCHLNVKPGSTYTQQDHSGFTANSTQDCSSCHSWPGTSTTTPNWLGATGAHASSGSTVSSTLDCNTCHGLNGSSSKHLAVAAASHYGGITNGNKCTSCHIDFTGFKDTITNLKYGHTNATANAGSCVNCHKFNASLYTTLTNTPPLSHPTAAGGHQFSQTFAVTGTFNGDRGSFPQAHTATKLTLCGSCHQYAATTSTTDIWAFKHRPSSPGVSNSQSTQGCNVCH